VWGVGVVFVRSVSNVSIFLWDEFDVNWFGESFDFFIVVK